MWQRGIKVQMEVSSQLALREMVVESPDGPRVIRRVLKNGRRRKDRGKKERAAPEGPERLLLAVTMEEGASRH